MNSKERPLPRAATMLWLLLARAVAKQGYWFIELLGLLQLNKRLHKISLRLHLQIKQQKKCPPGFLKFLVTSQKECGLERFME